MLKITTTFAAISVIALTAMAQPAFARDNGGAIAAGVIGGLAAGAIIGSQTNRGYYGGPGYYESGYQPVYSNCRYEREHFADRYGRYHSRRIRVCD